MYIVPDLTRAQQSMDKKLRDKLKEFKSNGEVNMKIQKGEIVRYVDGKKTVLYPVDNWLPSRMHTTEYICNILRKNKAVHAIDGSTIIGKYVNVNEQKSNENIVEIRKHPKTDEKLNSSSMLSKIN